MEVLANANQLVQTGRQGYQITQTAPNREFGKLYDHFNAMSAELQMQFQRSFLEQQATQQAKIKALQSQINPHFLNNTLEIINWEARFAENERVCAMIEALSTMLDAALDRDGRTQIALSQELVYVDAYLYIIQERLGDGFRVHKRISEDVLQQQIPRLILQPIVENAVEHDITRRRGGNLWVRAYRESDRMVLEVEHDGTMTEADRENIRNLLTHPNEETEKRSQVGLRNVSQRLGLIYGKKSSLTVEETKAGTILARITFPV
jgi:two-component system sensor histidine kinase YesM